MAINKTARARRKARTFRRRAFSVLMCVVLLGTAYAGYFGGLGAMAATETVYGMRAEFRKGYALTDSRNSGYIISDAYAATFDAHGNPTGVGLNIADNGNVDVQWSRSSDAAEDAVHALRSTTNVSSMYDSRNKTDAAWNLDQIKALHSHLVYTDPKDVWDGSRSTTHHFTSYLANGQVSSMDGTVYDSATWVYHPKSGYTGNMRRQEELHLFHGEFKVHDIDRNLYTLRSVVGDEIFVNDNIYVFVYPAALANTITNTKSSQYYFMNYMAFWAGTYTLNDYKLYTFNGVNASAVTNSVNNNADSYNPLYRLVDNWRTPAISDNIGTALRYGYNQLTPEQKKGVDGEIDYCIDVIVSDMCEGGGFYRLAIDANPAIGFKKVDARNNDVTLEGAQFTLYRDKECTDVYTTSKYGNGSYYFSEFSTTQSDTIPKATYYMKETKAPEGYQLDGSVYVLNVWSNGKQFSLFKDGKEVATDGDGYFLINNDTYQITITKEDDSSHTALAGARFAVSPGEGLFISSNITDENGRMTVGGLRPGVVYTITETAAPEGYHTAAPVRFSFDRSGNVSAEGCTVTMNGYDLAVTIGDDDIGVAKVEVRYTDADKQKSDEGYEVAEAVSAQVSLPEQFGSSYNYPGSAATPMNYEYVGTTGRDYNHITGEQIVNTAAGSPAGSFLEDETHEINHQYRRIKIPVTVNYTDINGTVIAPSESTFIEAGESFSRSGVDGSFLKQTISYNEIGYTNHSAENTYLRSDGQALSDGSVLNVAPNGSLSITVNYVYDYTPVGTPPEVVKSVSPASGSVVKTGDILTYTVNVTNPKPYDINGATLYGPIPSGAEYVEGSATRDGVLSGGRVVWSQLTLAAGETFTASYAVTVTVDASGGNEYINDQYWYAACDFMGDQTIAYENGNTALGHQKAFCGTEENNIIYLEKGTPYNMVHIKRGSGGANRTCILYTDGTYTETRDISTVRPGDYIYWTTVNGKTVWHHSGFVVRPAQPANSAEENTSTENLVSRALLTYTERDSDTASEIPSNIVSQAIVKIEKTSDIDESVILAEGSTITYTLKLKNLGSAAASGLTVTDALPEGLSYVSGADGYDEAAGAVIFSNVSVAPNGETSLVFTASVDKLPNGVYSRIFANTASVVLGERTLSVSNPVRNTVKKGILIVNYRLEDGTLLLQSKSGEGRPGDSYTDFGPAEAENYEFVSSEAFVNGERAAYESLGSYVEGQTVVNHLYRVARDPAAPEISKTASPESGSTVAAGDEITYTVSVKNNKRYAMERVTVTDSVPAGAEFVGSADGGLDENGMFTAVIASIPSGGTASVSFTVRVTGGETDGLLRNVANVYYKELYAGEYTEIDTNEVGHALLTVAKTSSVPEAAVLDQGDVITYTVTVGNIGSAPAADVYVTDVIPEGLTVTGCYVGEDEVDHTVGESGTLAVSLGAVYPGSTVTVTFNAVVNEFEIGRVTFTNRASASTSRGMTASGTVTSGEVVNSASRGKIYATYVDTAGHILDSNFVDEGKTGSAYETPCKTIANYELFKMPENAEGVFTDSEVEVRYIYQKSADTSQPTCVKTADPASGTVVVDEDEITYTVTVSNNKRYEMENVVVTDRIPAGSIFLSSDDGAVEAGEFTATIPSIGVGESASVSFTVKVRSYDADELLSNTARVSYRDMYATKDTVVTTNTVSHALLSAEKTSALNEDGSVITYTVTVRNKGTADIKDVAVSDTLDEDLTFVSADAGQFEEGVFTDVIGTLKAGETRTYTIVAEVVPFATGTVEVENAAVVTYDANPADDEDEPAVLETNRTVDEISHGSVTVTFVDESGEELTDNVFMNGITGEPYAAEAKELAGYDLMLTPGNSSGVYTDGNIDVIFVYSLTPDHTLPSAVKEASPASGSAVGLGEQIEYTISVTNNKFYAMKNVTVEDKLPEGVAFAASADGTVSGGVFTANIETIEPGETVSVSFKAVVTGSSSEGGMLSNTAEAVYTEIDGDTATVVPTNTVSHAYIAIDKISEYEPERFIYAGDEFTYTIKVMNNGSADAHGVVVTDKLPAAVEFVSAEEGFCEEGEFIAELGTLAAGEEKNVVITVRALELEENVFRKAFDNVAAVTFDKNDGSGMTDTETSRNVTNTVARGVLNVSYVDTNGAELAESIVKEAPVGAEYATECADIFGYNFYRDSGNTVGRLLPGVTEVVYTYTRASASAVVRYVDRETGESVAQPVLKNGFYVGDSIPADVLNREEIDNYAYVGYSAPEPLEFSSSFKEIIHYYDPILPQIEIIPETTTTTAEPTTTTNTTEPTTTTTTAEPTAATTAAAETTAPETAETTTAPAAEETETTAPTTAATQPAQVVVTTAPTQPTEAPSITVKTEAAKAPVAVSSEEADPAVALVSDPVNGSIVKTDQVIAYRITVVNPSKDDDIDNVVITDKIPTGATYVDSSASNGGKLNKDGEMEWSIGTLKAGDKVELSFKVKVGKGVSGSLNIFNKVDASYDNGKSVSSNSVSHAMLVSKFSSSVPEDTIVNEEGYITYTVSVTNIGSATAKDTEIVGKIPEGTSFVDVLSEFAEFSNTGVLGSVDIQPGETAKMSYVVSVDKLEDGVFDYDIPNVAYVNKENTNETVNKTASGSVVIRYVDETGAELLASRHIEDNVGERIEFPAVPAIDGYMLHSIHTDNDSINFIDGQIEYVYSYSKNKSSSGVLGEGDENRSSGVLGDETNGYVNPSTDDNNGMIVALTMIVASMSLFILVLARKHS